MKRLCLALVAVFVLGSTHAQQQQTDWEYGALFFGDSYAWQSVEASAEAATPEGFFRRLRREYGLEAHGAVVPSYGVLIWALNMLAERGWDVVDMGGAVILLRRPLEWQP